MPITDRFDSDLQLNGIVRFSQPPVLPGAICVGDAQIGGSTPVAATKLKHRWRPMHSQPHGTAATTDRKTVYHAPAAGTVLDFRVGCTQPPVGDSTVTVDLKRNGTSVVGGGVTLTNTAVAFGSVAGSVSAANYSANDVFEVVITVSAGTGTLPQGVFAATHLEEVPA